MRSDNDNTAERRRTPRAPVKGDATVSVGDEEGQWRIVNLSAGGALLSGMAPQIRVGRTAHLVLKLQDGSEVDVDGRVVRLEGGTRNIAVAFVDLDPDTEGRLHEVVRAALSDHDLGPRGKI